ncbi:hypothetical protein V502_00537 [Pseudogymnoascus sp. VKM F-4520 (FW-2644)]|nr:hypothetical protein V502_00537 [Pseudogymnoascus sp. VKM F-4520 (FW-2644)]
MTLFDVRAMHLFIDRYSIQGSPVVRIISPHAVDMAECLISRRLGPGREQPQNPLGAYRPEWQRVLGDDRGKSLDCRHYRRKGHRRTAHQRLPRGDGGQDRGARCCPRLQPRSAAKISSPVQAPPPAGFG